MGLSLPCYACHCYLVHELLWGQQSPSLGLGGGVEYRDPPECLTPILHEAPMPAALSALMKALPTLMLQLRVPDDGAVMDHPLLPLGYARFW